MFTPKMISLLQASPGYGRIAAPHESSGELNSYFLPLTPEEMTVDSDSSRDQVSEERTPCFPLTPDDLYLDTSPSILDDINSCTTLEDMNLCSPHDRTLRELSLCSPVTPGDVDVTSPHTPLDITFGSPEVSAPSPVISHVKNQASPGIRSDNGSCLAQNDGSVSFRQSPDESSSLQTSEDLGRSSPESTPETVSMYLPYSPDKKSCAELSHELNSGMPKMPSMVTASSTKVKAEFQALNPTDLLEQSQQTVLMPSTRVDTSSTSTPYTDAAQARKPARQGHIKRPMNAFMIWAQQQRHQIIARYPGSDNAKISKFLGSTWKMMTETEKAPFREEADRLKMLHIKEFPQYKYKPRKTVKRKSSKTETDEEFDQSSNRKRKATKKHSASTKSGSQKPRHRGEYSPSHCTSDCESQDVKRDLTSLSHSDSSSSQTESGDLFSPAEAFIGVASDEVKDAQKWDSSCSADVIIKARNSSPLEFLSSADNEALHVNISSPSNISSPGNISSRGNISSPGNISSIDISPGNVSSPENISSPGHISPPGNITSPGNISSSGNISPHGNISSSGNISSHGNISSSGNIFSSGNISLPGNVSIDDVSYPTISPACDSSNDNNADDDNDDDDDDNDSSNGNTEKLADSSSSRVQDHKPARTHTSARSPPHLEASSIKSTAEEEASLPSPLLRRLHADAQIKTSSPERHHHENTSTLQELRLRQAPHSRASEDPATLVEVAAAAIPSGDAVVLQDLTFSEDELEQLFATSADEGAFLSLVKYVIC